MTDVIQRNFAGGVVAPEAFGRADIVKYQTGVRIGRNFLVQRHGGMANRSGSQYITAQKINTQRGRILGFIFNAEQTYVLLFEHLTMRVIQNGILLTVPGATAWSNVTNYVVGDVASSAGVNYYCIQAHVNQAPPNGVYWYAMPAGDIYEIPTPFTTDVLPKLYRSQSGDVITLTGVAHDIYDLSRTGHTTWVLEAVVMEPGINPPASIAVSGVAGTVNQWVATAVKEETFEESIACAPAGANAAASTGAPRTLTIAPVAGALEYNVYKEEGSGIYGFIGVSKSGTYIDNGKVPDTTLTPPAERDPFQGAGHHPACSGYLQQRKSYGGMEDDPETLHGSKTGQYKNFGQSSPLRSDDAVRYPIASPQVNTIRHIIEVLESFILTAGVEWVAQGGADGALTPLSPGLKPKSYYGSAEVQPVVIGDNILFVQARGNLLRDLNYDVAAKGYTGRDLCVFAPHLFAGKTIERLAFAQIPNSIVYAQQDDGTLAALTYLREHEIWGWTPLDTDGSYEDVVVVPEGAHDAVYVLVKRTIDGTEVRYLERFASRQVSDVEIDAIFMDSYLTYDGRNTTSMTMTLSGGVDWTSEEELTLTASAGYFVAGDVGNAIRLTISTTTWTPEEGNVTTVEHLRLEILEYSSPTVVTVSPHKNVPEDFQDFPFANWAKGVDEFSGCGHLEGKSIAVLADGNVIANGLDDPLITVTGGAFTTDQPCYVLHAGLPYCSDIETLDLEMLEGETLTSKKKSINFVTLFVHRSRGGWVGPDFDHLVELKQRSGENYGEPLPMLTDKVVVSIPANWNLNGRFCIRQRDPLPFTILNAIPNVKVGA